MSRTAQLSNLSASGWDLVVAITQNSINSMLKSWMLYNLYDATEITMYFLAAPDGTLTQCDSDALKGVDPFAIDSSVDTSTDSDIQVLLSAGFRMACQFTPGFPADVDQGLWEYLPDLIAFKSDPTTTTFNLLCSSFQMVRLLPPSDNQQKPFWLNKFQFFYDDWTSKSDVTLSATTPLVQTTLSQAAYTTLPQAVQQQIQQLSESSLSVTTLTVDTSNAILNSTPAPLDITLDSPEFAALRQWAVPAYLKVLVDAQMPPVCCTISVNDTSSSSSLDNVTGSAFQICPYVDKDGVPINDTTGHSSLAFTCMTNQKPLPQATTFGFNWIDDSQVAFNGVAAVNRNFLLPTLQDCIVPAYRDYCVTPTPSSEYISRYGWTFSYPLAADSFFEPGTGDTLFNFGMRDQKTCKGSGLTMGSSWETDYMYTGSVELAGSDIIITQNQSFFVAAVGIEVNEDGTLKVNEDGTLQPEVTMGYLLKAQKVDKYNVAIDSNGLASFVLYSGDPVNLDLSQINGTVIDVLGSEGWDSLCSVPICSAFPLDGTPILSGRQTVFPCGRQFTLSNVTFSDNQDMLAYITYLDTAGGVDSTGGSLSAVEAPLEDNRRAKKTGKANQERKHTAQRAHIGHKHTPEDTS